MIVDIPTPLPPEVNLPIQLDDAYLDTPAILIDIDIAEANIARTAEYARTNGVAFRPHVKTHKSPAMAHRQLNSGAIGVCVAKVTEAEAFLEGGVSNITIAYPIIGTAKLGRLARLLDRMAPTLVTDSDTVLQGYGDLARRTGVDLDVLVEVDTGMHRVGLAPDAVETLVTAVERTPRLRFGGLLTHAGHAHDATDPKGIERVARKEAAILGSLREELERKGHEVRTISAGSTLTAPFLRSDDGITEVRPGTSVYNDLRTVECWSATTDQIAATTLARVVSIDGTRVTVDAGSKTLTMTHDPRYGFGQLLDDPSTIAHRLSEEHGVLTSPQRGHRVGDTVRILPIHVCVWMDLQVEVYGVRGDTIVERLPLTAMRHSL